MKIVIWGTHPLSTSGGGKICALMAVALRENNSVVVIANKGQSLGPAVCGAKEKPIRVIPFVNNLSDHLMSAVIDSDLVITIGDLWDCQPVHECIARTGKPWVAYVGCEGANYPSIAKFPDEKKMLIPKLVELISCFWAFTSHTEKILRRDFPGIPVEILPHAVDVAGIQAALPFPLRELLNIPDKRALWLFVGFNNIRKGIDLFMRQIDLYRDKVVGYIHSDDWYPTGWDLIEARKSLGLEGILYLKSDLDKITGKTKYANEEMYGIYKAADLFLHPHRAEGFGLCVLEALCAQIPVLATDCAGPSTYLPKACKIPTFNHVLYRQNGGVGYRMWEPQIPKLKPGRERTTKFDPKGYGYGDFAVNLNRLLEREYKPKMWMRAI